LYRQHTSFDPKSFDRLEPGFKALGRNIVFDDLKAAVPNGSTSFIHIVYLKSLIYKSPGKLPMGLLRNIEYSKKKLFKK